MKSIENKTIDRIAEEAARHGFWSLFRIDPIGGTFLGRMMRGFTPDIFETIEAASEIALNEEANYGRWRAIAKFRKLTRSVQ